MATTHRTDNLDPDLVNRLERFFRDYYRDELGELFQNFPGDQSHLTIDWFDLYRFDPDIADDYLEQPEKVETYFEEAIASVDLPHGINFDTLRDNVSVRVVNIDDGEVYQPLEVVREQPEGYLGVTGELSKVSTPRPILEVGVFECKRCGTPTRIPQGGDDLQEPHECQGCERQGPFELDKNESEFNHHSKVRIETPPDETGELQQEYVDGWVTGDLVWSGHDEYGIVARSGEKVKVYGQLSYRPESERGRAKRLFDPYLDVEAVTFEGDQEEVDIEAHRDEFEALAARNDAVDVFAESIAPELYTTPEWEAGLELLVAYLFGAPRIDIQDGPTFRGDIHALIVSDYGMGKSMVNSAVAMFSPKSIKESVTGMSSDVALLAAAVEDDFGGGGWTLEPGILVRANGGHVILDEIDKTDVNLERMNDALEGEQLVDIDKAGQSATYKSRVGLLATGNPVDSRFDPQLAIGEQLGIDQSLLSRFDGIVTMEDHADEEQDALVAETQGLSYVEAFEYQYGDRDELDWLERAVEVEVGRNWVAAAREECFPQPTREHVQRIRDWYSGEVRQLNETYGANEGQDMPAPASARVVPATIRFAVAFARVHLRDEVADEDLERAMGLSKKLVGQNFDGEKFVPQESRRDSSQKDKVEILRDELQGANDTLSISELQTRTGLSEDFVTTQLDKWCQSRDVMEPSMDEYRWIA